MEEKIKYSIKDKTMIIELGKELDHHNAVALTQEIDRNIYSGNIKNIIFDFKNTTFMDSSGIGVILGRNRLLKNAGGIIGVANLNRNIDRILTMSGVYKIVKKVTEI